MYIFYTNTPLSRCVNGLLKFFSCIRSTNLTSRVLLPCFLPAVIIVFVVGMFMSVLSEGQNHLETQYFLFDLGSESSKFCPKTRERINRLLPRLKNSCDCKNADGRLGISKRITAPQSNSNGAARRHQKLLLTKCIQRSSPSSSQFII